eukprot:4031508-Prymnesium_polylepis.1
MSGQRSASARSAEPTARASCGGSSSTSSTTSTPAGPPAGRGACDPGTNARPACSPAPLVARS